MEDAGEQTVGGTDDADPMVNVALQFKFFPVTPECRREIETLVHSISPDSPIVWKRICDGCDSEDVIPDQTTDTIFQCTKCDMKFDLCTDCQTTRSKIVCPSNYGCALRTQLKRA